MYHLNVQSLRNKLDELELWLNKFPYDVITINEHWLTLEETSLYVPIGYLHASSYCRQYPYIRGGTCIFVKNNIEYEVVDMSKFSLVKVFEVSTIFLPKINTIIATVYHTPDADVDHFLQLLGGFLKFICKKYKSLRCIIAGDFNININNGTNDTTSFLNLLRSFDFYCLNYENTRENACLDNILTNLNRDNIDCKVIQPNLSDHAGVLAIFFEIPLKSKFIQDVKPKTVYKNIRTINPFSINKFKAKLTEIDWSQLYFILNVDQAYEYFMFLLTSTYNECCYIKEIKINNNKKPRKRWFTPQLKQLRDHVIFLYDKFKQSQGTINEFKNKKIYGDVKKIYKSKIKQEKLIANENYINNSQNKCKAAWNVIKSEVSGSKKPQVNCIDSSEFNDYFINCALELTANQVPDNCDLALELLENFTSSYMSVNSSFKWRRVMVDDVLRYISKLSTSQSEDFYGFSNKIIKEISNLIAQPLAFLFNFSLERGIFPSILKITKVIPIFKKGEKTLPSSYRPISLVPILSKVFECCVKDQLYNFFVKSGILSNEQYGFLPGLSTTKGVETLVENILLSFEKKLVSSATLIDLSKAFDCISHELLLKKLHCYGIKDLELQFFTSYLTNRKQMVVQGDDKSDFKNIKVGVPQGSVLGPFLFIIAVNDFSHNMPCRSVLYADDTTLLNCNEDIESLMQQEEQAMKAAFEWFKANFLIVNSNKTESIIFSLDHRIYKDIKPVKLLGLHLDSRLSWDDHIDHLCKKLARVTCLLRKLKHNVSNEMWLSAYYAFFQSQLTYGITLWGNSSNSSKVFIWQKRALRIIKNFADTESCFPIFQEYQILPLPCLYIKSCLISVKEMLELFHIRKDFHHYPTRKNYMLDTFCARLEKTNKSHICMKIKLFNKLPESAWTVGLNKFKVELSNWLNVNFFYTIEQYLKCDTSNLSFN